MSVGFQGRDEESLRKAKASHPAVPERSAALVRAAQRKNADKELRRAVRNFLNLGSSWHHEELRSALKICDEVHRE